MLSSVFSGWFPLHRIQGFQLSTGITLGTCICGIHGRTCSYGLTFTSSLQAPRF